MFFNKMESKVVILLINGECVFVLCNTYLSGEIIVLQIRGPCLSTDCVQKVVCVCTVTVSE